MNAAALWSQAYLVTCGSLLGYSGYIYLLEHVPVGKVASYAYVNPVVAVLLGIVPAHERPAAEEFAGMAAVLLAVFLLTTAQIKLKHAAHANGAAQQISMEYTASRSGAT